MADTILRGMSWDHRRALDPLIGTMPGFRASRPGTDVQWSSRPLSGFEFTPVGELAERYDLIVLDHPFVGEIAAEGSLLALDGMVDGQADSPFVGPSLASYRWRGHLWAVPIDAACQVGVVRPDLLARLDRPAPADWAELIDLARAARRRNGWLAVALNGVHALMTFFTLAANLGRPCATEPDKALFDPATAREALSALRELVSLCPPQCLDWNSIALHDAMVARDDLVACPAVYCYATYAESDQRRPLRFHDLPGPSGHRGSTIGGTGLGISARCRHPEAAMAYVHYVTRAETQLAFAAHHGQPARREAWEDEATNDRFGGCYRSTRATIEAAWVRPRYRGYLAFQAKAGELVEAHLRGRIAEADLLDEMERLHSDCSG